MMYRFRHDFGNKVNQPHISTFYNLVLSPFILIVGKDINAISEYMLSQD